MGNDDVFMSDISHICLVLGEQSCYEDDKVMQHENTTFRNDLDLEGNGFTARRGNSTIQL